MIWSTLLFYNGKKSDFCKYYNALINNFSCPVIIVSQQIRMNLFTNWIFSIIHGKGEIVVDFLRLHIFHSVIIKHLKCSWIFSFLLFLLNQRVTYYLGSEAHSILFLSSCGVLNSLTEDCRVWRIWGTVWENGVGIWKVQKLLILVF